MRLAHILLLRIHGAPFMSDDAVSVFKRVQQSAEIVSSITNAFAPAPSGEWSRSFCSSFRSVQSRNLGPGVFVSFSYNMRNVSSYDLVICVSRLSHPMVLGMYIYSCIYTRACIPSQYAGRRARGSWSILHFRQGGGQDKRGT